jgi:hypothetical protein
MPPVSETPEDLGEEPEETAWPTWALPVALALGGGLLFVVMSSDKKEGKGK